MAQREHIENQFLEKPQELYSEDNENFRQKYESENEITDVLDRRIKILEKELERANAEIQKTKDAVSVV